MNKPVGTGTARIEPAAPVNLVPKPPPTVPAGATLSKNLADRGAAVARGARRRWRRLVARHRRSNRPLHHRAGHARRGHAHGDRHRHGQSGLTIIVGTYVSGVIQELYCDYNTQVKKGQVCAKIDPRPYQTVVDQDKANLAVAKAQLEKDKASLAYAKLNLRAQRAAGADQRGLARTRSTAPRAPTTRRRRRSRSTRRRSSSARPQLDAAQVNLGYTNIVSPVDGTVVSRNVTMGQTVAASFQTPTLFLIATDLTKMQVDTNVSESDIGGIKEGNKAIFTVDAFPKRTFEGTVTQVRQAPQTVQNVVTYDVVVSVDNPDLALKPGMTAATRIVIDERDDVLRVPEPGAALCARRRRGAGDRSGRSRRGAGKRRSGCCATASRCAVPVVVGLDDDSFTEIVSGELKPGDRGHRRRAARRRGNSRPCRAPRL